MTQIIGLRGKKGVGKNFVATVAMEAMSFPGSTQKIIQGSFAGNLKDFCVNVLGLTRNQVDGTDQQKNSPTKYRWEKFYMLSQYDGKTGFMTARQVMQIFGTEIIRNCFAEDIWVESLRRKIESSGADIFFVTDVRFANEVRAIREWGGQVWMVNGPQRGEESAKMDTHVTETELEGNDDFDVMIKNNLGTTREDLSRQISAALGLA